MYSASRRAKKEFPEYPDKLRYAISLGRLGQNAELEFAGLFVLDREALFLDLHPLQKMLDKEELWEALEQEVITAINRSGVDINNAVAHYHHGHALQVCQRVHA